MKKNRVFLQVIFLSFAAINLSLSNVNYQLDVKLDIPNKHWNFNAFSSYENLFHYDVLSNLFVIVIIKWCPRKRSALSEESPFRDNDVKSKHHIMVSLWLVKEIKNPMESHHAHLQILCSKKIFNLINQFQAS